jgi:hypothetical protein
MQVSATVRVKPDAGEKPDQRKLEQAAELLQKAGLDVVRVGRFGVSIKGEHTDVSRVLGVEAVPGKPLSAPAEPAEGELRKLVDHVEMLPPPKLF